MAKKRVFKPRIAGFKEVRRAPKLIAEIDRITDKLAEEANKSSGDDGYRTSSLQGKARPQGRWRGTVISASRKARKDNGANNTLVKELLNVRGK